MSADGLLACDFGALPELIRAHAAERPNHPALTEGDETLTYGGLAALMDRVAFALQRDGARNGEAVAICAKTSINYAAAFCGVLAAGAAVAPLAPSSTPASLLMMLKDSGAKLFLLDRETAEALRGTGYEEAVKRVALDDSEAGEPFSSMDRPGRRKARRCVDRPRTALQHHLFVGHDRRAQGHRPAASHAVGTVQTAPLQGRGDDRSRRRSIRTRRSSPSFRRWRTEARRC